MSQHAPVSQDAPLTEVAYSPTAFVGAIATFALIGAMQSLYGPLIDGFAHAFHVSIPEAGEVLSVHFVGALVGVLCGWMGVKRFDGRVVLSGALVALAAGALGALGAATIKHWPPFLAGVFLIGVGFGALDFSLNTLLARTALRGRARRLTVANGGYGVGAVIGPLLVVALRPHRFPILLAAVGIGAVFLLTSTRGVRAPRLRHGAQNPRPTFPRQHRLPILATFVGAYVLYIAVETSSSGWMATQLHGEGFAQSTGSLVTSGFWTLFALGRFAGGPLHRWINERLLVLGGLGLAVVALLLCCDHVIALAGYPLLGLVLASVFPMGLVWYTLLIPEDHDGLALLILFMMAGGVLGPGLVSVMVSVAGVHVVPLVIAALAVADIAVFASALRFHPL